MLIDLHTHTYSGSEDSAISPDELIEAARGVGLDGLCITEHDYFWDHADISALSRRHNFLVLSGCEVNTDAGHALVFGLDRYEFGMHRVDRLRQHVDRAGGAMLAAHPYRRRFLDGDCSSPEGLGSAVDAACADGFFFACDAVEVLNGRATGGETAFSLELAQRLGLGMVGGSDSHRLDHLGTVATRFHGTVTCLEELIQELKEGRFEPAVLDRGRSLGW